MPTSHARTRRPIVLLLLAIGCGGSPDAPAEGTVTDSAGVALVSAPAADRALPWALEEIDLIGGADSGAEAFTRASRDLVMTDGRDRIAVYDRDASQVRVFDGAGEALHALGGPGGGPGEIGFGFGLFDVGPGRVAVFDFAKNALLTWSLEGELLSEGPLGIPGGGWDRGRLVGDTLLVSRTDVDSTRTLTELVRMAPADTQVIMAVESPPRQMAQMGCFAAQIPPMFAPGVAWAAHDDRVAVLRQDRYVVDLYRAGRLERSIRRDIVGRETTPADADSLYPEGMKVSFGGQGGGCTVEASKVAEAVGMADRLPVLRDVAFGPEGSIWVQRYGFPGSEPVTDVFDATGRYLGTDHGHGLPLGALSNGRVLFAAADTSTGVTRIGIHAMPELADRP
ncbi:MAG TPA: hypothetical protein P5135_05945 [Gemmatimonadales bacterium]|nr:hypothetical protein [Gemmatimonadales bacterium]